MGKKKNWFHCPTCGRDWKYWKARGGGGEILWGSTEVLEVEDHTEMRFCPDHIEKALRNAAKIILSPSVKIKK